MCACVVSQEKAKRVSPLAQKRRAAYGKEALFFFFLGLSMAAADVVERGDAPEELCFFFFFSVAAQSVKGDELLLVCLCS